MIRIKYPTNRDLRLALNDLYLKKIGINDSVKLSADVILKRIIFQGEPLNVERVLLMDFHNLREINLSICHHLNIDELEELVKLFNYDIKQQNIASFFMEQSWIPLDSCFYCNLDGIYSFVDMLEYESPLDFVNTAAYADLIRINGVADLKAKAIIAKRSFSPFKKLKEVPVGKIVRDKIKAFQFGNSHNHFTIDHFHHKDLYSFISISLHNLIPSCYSCNSKFKKIKEIGKFNDMKFISPSSIDFDLRHNFSFKLYLRQELHEIKTVEDFTINSETINGDTRYSEFLKAFKITGRYKYHKFEALELIKKKVEYPTSKIKELAEYLGKSEDELRKDLFGPELFESEYDQKHLIKFKRDIARSINISGTLGN